MFSVFSGEVSPLITVWLQVRVLPGPPVIAREGCRAEIGGNPELHQVYGKEGDHYHLLKSYYGSSDD
jgi:hypothetical protein